MSIWHLMRKFGFLDETLTMVYCDNPSAIQVVEKPIAHSKMKHTDIHAHYLRQLVQENVVNLVYYKNYDHVFYIFMNPLSEAKLLKLWVMIGLQKSIFMGGSPKEISPPKSLEHCVDGVVLEQQAISVHHTSGCYGES